MLQFLRSPKGKKNGRKYDSNSQTAEPEAAALLIPKAVLVHTIPILIHPCPTFTIQFHVCKWIPIKILYIFFCFHHRMYISIQNLPPDLIVPNTDDDDHVDGVGLYL
jgi:hypothetical protein